MSKCGFIVYNVQRSAFSHLFNSQKMSKTIYDGDALVTLNWLNLHGVERTVAVARRICQVTD